MAENQQQQQQQQDPQQQHQQQPTQQPQPKPRQNQQQPQQIVQVPPPLAPIYQQPYQYLFNQQPPQLGINQPQLQQWAITDRIVERLGDISSGQEKKDIPNYNGYANEKAITEWMPEAEALAVINNWHVDVQKKYIGSRLKGPVLNWHVERIRDFPNATFAEWKQELINNF